MLMKILFIVYLIFLVWAVLFKFNLSLSDVRSVREVNWIPFYYENVEKGDIPLLEALMNLLIFIPFGFLLERACKKSFWKMSLFIVLVSVGFELAQYCLSIGASDITDVITNTAGGLVGITVSRVMRYIRRSRRQRKL